MEAGGLVDAEQFKLFDKIDELRKAGKLTESIDFLKSVKWLPQGLKPSEMKARFPWARYASLLPPLCLP
jgi:hypothetical protein